MNKTDRRTFLKVMGAPALLAAMPGGISRMPATASTRRDSGDGPAIRSSAIQRWEGSCRTPGSALPQVT
jgi:hypothetical protein